MSSQRRTGRITAEGFPYYYLGDALEMAVEVGGLTHTDGATAVGEPHKVRSDRRISLVNQNSWSSVDLAATVNVPEKVFKGTLPTVERGEYAPGDSDGGTPPVRLVLAIRSRDTIL